MQFHEGVNQSDFQVVALQSAVSNLGVLATPVCLSFGSACGCWRSRRQHTVVAHGMLAIFPTLAQDAACLADYLDRHCRFLARDTLDCFVMPRSTRDNALEFLRVTNPEVLENARKQGKGVIHAVAHFGYYFMLELALRFAGLGFCLLTTRRGDDNPHYDPFYLNTCVPSSSMVTTFVGALG